MPKYTLVLAAALTIASGSAMAAFKPSFFEADKNHDNKVTIKEAENAGIPKKMAEKADIDGDGALTRNDWKYIHFKKRKKPGEQNNLKIPGKFSTDYTY